MVSIKRWIGRLVQLHKNCLIYLATIQKGFQYHEEVGVTYLSLHFQSYVVMMGFTNVASTLGLEKLSPESGFGVLRALEMMREVMSPHRDLSACRHGREPLGYV